MKALKVTIVILVLILIAEVGFLFYFGGGKDLLAAHPTAEATAAPTTDATTEAPTTEAPTEAPTEEATTEATIIATEVTTEASTEAPTEAHTEAPTEAPTEEPTEAPTEAPTEEPTEAPTEPQPETFLLTFAGSCTLGSTPADADNPAGYLLTVGDNYSHPFAKVQDYFANDEFTLVNLEGILSDSYTSAKKQYAFVGPSAYAAILSQGSVEAVSLANDHTSDFGSTGYAYTKDALSTEGVSYVENGSTLLYTTKNGFKIGVYAVHGALNQADMKKDFAQLKKDGADVIVAFFHWGVVDHYTPSKTQISYGHTAVDLGADIVIGTGPHAIQPIESYKNRYICYSLGNFSYGGIKWPTNPDTAIVQLEIIRDVDQSVSIGELRIIPCSMTSSGTGQNNYQPIPLDADNWQYTQILNKLSKNVAASQNTTAGTTATKPSQQPTEPSQAPTDPSTDATEGTDVPTTEAPTDAPADTPTDDSTESTQTPSDESSQATEGGNADVPNTDASQQ